MKRKLRSALLAGAVLAGLVGYAAAQNPYYDGYDRDGYGYGHGSFRHGMHVAREVGFADGTQVAREDLWKGKPFNPRPRGRYDDADHGYRPEFGSIHEYREHYADAYREGYISTFRHYRY
jgi:hypothetical protein